MAECIVGQPRMDPEPDKFIPTRRSLLSRLKGWDDEDSWREFFDTYWRLIYSVALKAGLNACAAEDLVQETVLSVAQRMPGFTYDPSIGSFKSWLMAIVRRRIADHFRAHYRNDSRTESRADLPEDIADDSLERLEAIWEQEWQIQIRQAALEKVKRRVTPQQFQMFDFYVMQRVPVREVAKTLGVSLMQVYLARHRIGQLIKGEIENLEKSMV
jgi:RNA polymerase sigma-70 factor (ECF subfamily)